MAQPAAEIIERQRRFTVAEYDRMIEAGILHEDEHVQLIDGVLVALTPQKSPHAYAIQVLNRQLVRALGEEYAVRPQLPLVLGTESEPEPDLAVVRASSLLATEHPRTALLVIEVSDDSLRLDRRVKAALYARHAIPEYWIVNLVNRRLEAFRDPDPAAGSYTTALVSGPGEQVTAVALPGVVVAVADLFGR